LTPVARETFGRRISYAAMIALLTVTLFVVLALVWRAFFNDQPVHVVSMDEPFAAPICPGDQYVLNNRVTVDRPVVLFFYLSVMDENAERNINDTQTSFPGRIHPTATTFHQLIPWTVPDLPPGKYIRAFAARGTDGRENPVILLSPFEIGNCK
jgi:hypothetical protein